MNQQNKPLVSIIIITYNSADTVIETLDSALGQTYKNIEIIISDDCSSDDTLEVCRRWIREHDDSNKRIKLVETKKNTGVAGNCNRGLRVAQGQWIKTIAGDDILTPTSVETYMSYVTEYPCTRHLIADLTRFTGSFNERRFIEARQKSFFVYRKDATASWQYSIAQKMFIGSGPTYFIHTDTLREIGGYDERFPMQEDYPLFIKMLRMGYKMEYINQPTVYYRVSATSLSHNKDINAIFTSNHVRIVKDYKYLYRLETLNLFWRILHYYSLRLQELIIRFGNSKRNPICLFFKLVYSITDPFIWFARYIKYREFLYDKKHGAC